MAYRHPGLDYVLMVSDPREQADGEFQYFYLQGMKSRK